MFTTVQGTYYNGLVSFDEKLQLDKKVKVLITFLEESPLAPVKKSRKPGGLKGQIWISDDFNEPLDDLKEYM